MDTLRLILAIVGTASLGVVAMVMLRLRKVNKELTQQRSLLETLLNNIPDQIYFKDRMSRFVKVNKAVAKFLNIKTTDEVVGKNDLDFCRKEDAEAFRADDQQVMDSKQMLLDRIERGIIMGKETWMSTTKAPFFDEHGHVAGVVGISRDITDRVRTQNILKEVVSKARCILWDARVTRTKDDFDWRFTVHSSAEINKEFNLATEPNTTSLWGVPIAEEQLKQMNIVSRGALRSGAKGYQQEIWVTMLDGSKRWLREDVQVTPITENEWALVGVAIDITERKRAEEQLAAAHAKLEILAREDGLTGLLNRRTIVEAAEAEWARWDRFSSNFTVMMIDVDDFKKVNDSFGHASGDVVLKTLAALLKTSIRTVDRVGRYGGEEFLIVLPETQQEGAAALGEKILSALRSNPLRLDITMKPVSVSIGVATVCKGDKHLSALIHRADTALYEAKKAGKARVVAAGLETADERR
jgi:diguanylate cyclase (GGDEF)-like protein/PAS domain S-box-containing protein